MNPDHKIEEYRRWSFEVRGDKAFVCYGCHEKSLGCVWVPLNTQELVDIIKDLRGIILENSKEESEMDEKYCIDCEHFYEDSSGTRTHWYCCGRITEPIGTDLVTGVKIMKILDAKAERKGEGSELCGESGRFFEPKAE